MKNISDETDTAIEEFERLSEKLSRLRVGISSFVIGQQKVVDLSLTTILSGGHALLIGVPGLAKTRLVETLGVVLGLEDRRIQFTPDLMPSDILGSEILDEDAEGKRYFRFIKGPIFGQLLMADEINRASPRTQSALLQAMQEDFITIAGERHTLPHPFHVLATQNPLEQEGTYPLPEAQLDRFLMQIDITYPDLESERRILLETTGIRNAEPQPILTQDDVMQAQQLVRRMPIADEVMSAILTLVRAGRPGESELNMVNEFVAWGPGPRASQALVLASRAQALLDQRISPSVEDVISLAKPVLQHRMALNYNARAEGINLDIVIDELLKPLQQV
jgi:MoxR-like ATPase